MLDQDPSRTYIPVDTLGWSHSRLAFLRLFLACAVFALGFYSISSSFAGGPTLLLAICIGLLIVVNGAESSGGALLGLQLVCALGLWKLGYVVMQFREVPFASVDWPGVLTAVLTAALLVELAVGFLTSFSCGPREALFLREDVGSFSFVRGLFGAPSGFAVVTGYKILPTFLFALSLMVALALGERLFSLLIWRSSNEHITTSALTVIYLAVAVYFLRTLAKWCAPKSARVILQRDTRSPIVFLRAFSDDRVSLNPPSLFIFDRILNLSINPNNLDQLLVMEFSTYGPVIAVGDPSNRVETFGVYRDFLGDYEWRDYVREKTAQSAAIVIVPDFSRRTSDLSEGVKWELKMIKSCGLLDKTLILAPKHFQDINENGQFWARVGETLDVDFDLKKDKSYLGVYFEEADQRFLLSEKYRTDSYRLALRHFFRFKRFKAFAY